MLTDWDEFMGSIKRTTRSHYKLKRRCERCQRFITDANKASYCHECKAGLTPLGLNSKGYRVSAPETTEHKALKELAVKFLESEGCTDIRQERKATLSRDQRGKKHNYVIFDVAGVKNGKLIVVECGGSQEKKLLKALLVTPDVFILPYNALSPFKYQPKLKLCTGCGNIKGVKS